jgi:ABC-type nitrate/sulfonate/bicarbonate transport system substrate-binding protein
MRRGSRLTLSALAVAAATIVGACSGTTPSPSGDGAEETTIFFGTGSTQAEVYLLPLLTYGREALAADGIALEYAALSGDEVVAAALDRGRIDVALISLLGAQRAIGAGLDIRWTLTNETQNTFVLVVPGDVSDLSQLKGKKIGVQDATSLSSVLLPALMEQAGVGQDEYETVYLSGSGNRAAALTAGTMDATILFRAVASTLEDETGGDFKIWGTGAPTLEAMMWEGFAMSGAFRQNKDLATKFAAAALAAYERFYAGDPQAMAEAMLAEERPETAGLDPAEVAGDFALYQQIKLFPTDGGLDEAYFTRMNELLVDVGQIEQDATLDYGEVVDRTFVDAAP